MSEIRPFNIINPLDFSEETIKFDTYFEQLRAHWRMDNGGEHVYLGSTDLYRLTDGQVLGVGTIMRIWQTELPEMLMLTKLGLMPLARYGNPSKLLVPPFRELDTNSFSKGRPHHWNIEGFELVTDEDIITEIEGSKNA